MILTKLLLACVTLVFLTGKETTMRIPLAGDIDEVSFDPSVVSPKEVRRWLQFSPNVGPYNGYLVPEGLELCLDNSPDYAPCGTRDQKAPNFRHNAQVNLAKIRTRIHEFNMKRYPPDLDDVVKYVKRIQEFALWSESQRLAFAKTGSVSALELPFEQINPKVDCAPVLRQLRDARDQKEAFTLARSDWHNCVWHAEKKQIGPYPKTAWEAFLAAHHIRERFIPEEIIEP